MKLILIFTLLLSSAFAVENSPDKAMEETLKSELPEQKGNPTVPYRAQEKKGDPITPAVAKVLHSQDLRDESTGTLTVGYQLLTTWIPSKWTVSYTQILSHYWSIEGEYAKGSLSLPVAGVDIGGISERRATLQARYYPGNSFNFTFGFTYHKAIANLGGDIPATTGKDFFTMENIGATVGIGNRWQWKNGFTLGIDWLRINQPLFGKREDEAVLKTVSPSHASDLKKIMHAFNNLPTFVLLGFQLGYTF
jgi:hypothetical protein